jgi:hypothetical protein
MANPRLLRAPRTDLGAFLAKAGSAIKRRSLVFVVSDFVGVPGWDRALGVLNRRHETLGVRLVDPMDQAMPDLGLLPFEDAESGEQLFVDTGDRRFRKRFAEAAQASETALMEGFVGAGCDVLELSTGDDLVDAIRRFADLRKGMRAAASGGGMPTHLTPAMEAAP